MLAIVSKKVFEHDFGGVGVGEVVATERYASSHETLDKLADMRGADALGNPA